MGTVMLVNFFDFIFKSTNTDKESQREESKDNDSNHNKKEVRISWITINV